MGMHLLPFITLLLSLFSAVRCHEALPSQAYWNSVLPNTPMPKAISDLLPPGALEEGSTSVDVDIRKGGGVHVTAGKGKPGGADANIGSKDVDVRAAKPGEGTTVGVGRGGVSVNTGRRKRKPVNVSVKPGPGTGPSPFLYNYAATEDQLHDDPNVALFFLKKDLKPGTKMNLHFVKTTNTESAFLPRPEADSIPFSSNDFPSILNKLSVKRGTPEAVTIEETIKECEEPGNKSEDKHCATSLESMIDFAVSKLGRSDVEALSTEAGEKTQKQEYRIVDGVKKSASGGESVVVCHKQKYPYAVFYCHHTRETEAYSVPLVGADGTKAKAVAICHRDTSAWNPKHLAFRVLGVKPGTTPICHFLPQDHIVWAPN